MAPPFPAAVHQLTPTLAWGDAVGNQIRLLQRWFKGAGTGSDVFAGRTDEASRAEAFTASELADRVEPGDAVLVHHSIQSHFLPLLRKVARRANVVVVYHNVTPPELLAGFDASTARACAAARVELKELAELAALGLAYSDFSAEDLRAAGFRAHAVVPYPLDFDTFNAAPEASLKAELEDGCTNILFVGRGSPNKRLEAVVRAFTAYQRLFDPNSRLVLAGGLDRDKPYGQWVHAVIESLRPERVHLLGRVSAAQLSACFDTADVYLSLSAHEGFGVPMVESMHRGVPVIAYGAGAVPETLGGAGVVCRKDDPVAIARVIAAVARNPELQGRLVKAGKRRAKDFSEANTRAALFQALSRVAPRLRGAIPLRVVGGAK